MEFNIAVVLSALYNIWKLTYYADDGEHDAPYTIDILLVYVLNPNFSLIWGNISLLSPAMAICL